MRSALAALLTTALLAAGCSDDGPSVSYPDRLPAPSESASEAPARLHWKVSEPVIADFLGAYSQEDAEEVWNLAVDMVKKWHINPRLLQTRRYQPSEFLPVAKLMTPKPAKEWKRDVRRAIRGLDRGGAAIDHVAQRDVFALVVWNLPQPQDGAWRDPMVAKPKIQGAVLPAISALRVQMRVTANFRIDRGVEDPVLPYSTTLNLYYRQHEGEWLLDIYSSQYKVGQEVLTKPKKKKRPASDAGESPSDTASSGE